MNELPLSRSSPCTQTQDACALVDQDALEVAPGHDDESFRHVEFPPGPATKGRRWCPNFPEVMKARLDWRFYHSTRQKPRIRCVEDEEGSRKRRGAPSEGWSRQESSEHPGCVSRPNPPTRMMRGFRVGESPHSGHMHHSGESSRARTSKTTLASADASGGSRHPVGTESLLETEPEASTLRRSTGSVRIRRSGASPS